MTLLRELARFMRALVMRSRARRSSRRAGVVLVYHRVGGAPRTPDVEIDPGVPGRPFSGQLRHLRRHYRVVPAAEILNALSERRRGQPFPVAITFDDDLSSHVLEALPALRRAELPATFFLSGSSLSGPHSLWWEDLARAIEGRLVSPGGLPYVPEDDVRAALDRSPGAIRRLASAIERLEPGQRDEVAAALRAAIGSPRADGGLRTRDVRAFVEAGFTVGFHTLRHDALPSLSDTALEQALRSGRDALATAAGHRLDLIAYPHGKADDRVAEAARAAGFARGFTTKPGLVSPETDPRLIPRIVPAASVGAFTLQLARLFADRA